MDASEALLLSERNNRDCDGYGMGGGVFMWVIVLVLIFFAFGWGRNGGWGNNGDGYGNVASLLAAQGRTQDLAQTERDVLMQSCKTQEAVFNTACATQKEILESRYTTQLGFQNQQAQLAQCCCDIKQAIANDGEQTRALIQNNTIQALRDANEQKDRQILLYQLTAQNLNQSDVLINTLLPRAIPAYPSCSPYMATFYGMNGYGLFNNNGGCGCNNGCGCGG